MDTIVNDIALAMISIGFLLALIRVARGPSVADRAVGADVALSAVVGSIALAALRTGAQEFLDVVLVATLLGFLAAVALSVLVGRRGS